MKRSELTALLDEFAAAGGGVQRLPEGAVSVDWSNSPMRRLCAAVAQVGRARRIYGRPWNYQRKEQST